MSFWRTINTAAYGAWYRLRNRRRPAPRLAPAGDAGRPRLLYVAWGRIGDTVLSTGVLQHLRTAFDGCEIVYAGRPETRLVAEPFVDRFVTFDAIPHGPYAAVLGDVHLFYGGVHALGALIEALPAQRKLVYEGYHLGPGLAPVRIYPRDAEVVPASPAATHVLEHDAHFFAEAVRRLRGEAFDAPASRPVLRVEATPEARERFGDAIAWQPLSRNRKKDYPMQSWREVIALSRDVRFVALGTEDARAAVDALRLPNVTNLCGRTDLAGAMDAIAAARGFLGPDSGLTHVAACLGKPTVCVAQNSNLGTFFPYPEAYRFDNLRTVFNPRYRWCAGCFMTCSHEPILATWARGAKCVRELPPQLVIEAMREHLAQPVLA